jgi:hypothetical protein
VGCPFGVKRGRDRRAQRLMASGMLRFPDYFALSPPGGYSGEGSTCFCQIVAPVVSWYCALMEQITGSLIFTDGTPRKTGCSLFNYPPHAVRPFF